MQNFPFWRRAPAAPEPHDSTPDTHPLDGPIQALYRGDGTQSKRQFQQQTLPLLQCIYRAAQARDPATADAALESLVETIVSACQRASNQRLPKGGQITDYRRFETLYNYALISAMAVAWHADAEGLGEQGPQALAETLLPPEGLCRLRQEPLVWQHWQGFFDGGEDGGLREVSGRGDPPARLPQAPTAPEQSSAAPPVPADTTLLATAGNFVTPHPAQRADPLAKGWLLVEAIRQGLREGSLAYNGKQAWVQVDREGRTFLQVPEVFTWCHARLKGEGTAKTLINQFGRLNICTRTRKGQNLLRGGRRDQTAYQQGFVVEDPALLWEGEPPVGPFYIRHLTRELVGQAQDAMPDFAV